MNFESEIQIANEWDKAIWDGFISDFIKSDTNQAQNYLALAHYAAFPVILNTDLLYKIYLNFIKPSFDTEGEYPIWQASEFLFSPIIRELGFDLYEIYPNIREVLLEKLRKKHFQENVSESTRMAYFMQEYLEKCRAKINTEAIAKAQEINYKMELDPDGVINEIFSNSKISDSKVQRDRIGYLLAWGKKTINNSPNENNSGLLKKIEDIENLFSSLDDGNFKNIEKALDSFDISSLSSGLQIPVPQNIFNNIISKRGLDEKPTKRKLRALVITSGDLQLNITKAKFNSGKFFENKLKSILSKNELECQFISGLNFRKNIIIDELNSIIKNTKQQDDLILYVAAKAKNQNGKCEISCAVAGGRNLTKIEKNMFISDFEIGDLFKSVICASITIILQVDHAASPYWLENIKNFKTKTIVFASCKFEQFDENFTQKIENKDVSVFTNALVESITITKNNRNIFASTLQLMEKYSEAEKSMESIAFEIKHPVLIGNSETYNLNFIKGADEDFEIRNQLFKANFTNKTAYELGEEEFISLKSQNLEFTNKLKEIEKLNAKLPPIFLLIYSDFTQKLEHLKREKTEILNLLAPLNVLVLLLENPDSVTFSNLMKAPKYRNRIQLIYYAGYDDNEGNMYLNEKAFNIDEFAALLDYQENIKVFFSNTCRSKLYAEYLTQMGVKYSYGFEGEVTDQIAAEKGVEFFRKLATGESMQDLVINQNFNANFR